MKEFKKLIDRLNRDKLNTALIEHWYQSYLNKDFSIRSRNELYENLYGFVFGLETVGYISSVTLDSLLDELLSHYTIC